MLYNYFGDFMYLLYGSIHNYSCDEYKNFYQKLSFNDKNRYQLILRDNDKKLFLLSRILLSNISLKYFEIDYNKLNIYYNDFGKPLCDKFYFNISHSYEYAVCVSSLKRIGVDIEKIRDVDDNMIHYFCSDLEMEYVYKSNHISQSFFKVFCVKEAYFKMKGTSILGFMDIEYDSIINDNSLNISILYDVPGYIIAVIEEKD